MTILPARFWAKVFVPFTPGGCWMWTAGKNGDGYGTFGVTLAPYRYQARGAHRVAYEALVGAIPADAELDHLCRNRACVRPDHLQPVAHRANVLRGEGVAARAARRTSCPNGHPYDMFETGRRCSMCRRAHQRAAAARRRGVA